MLHHAHLHPSLSPVCGRACILKVVFCGLNASGVYLDFLLLLIFILFLPFVICFLISKMIDHATLYLKEDIPKCHDYLSRNTPTIVFEIWCSQTCYMAAFHFDSMMEIRGRGELLISYVLSYYLSSLTKEPWNWNVVPLLVLWYMGTSQGLRFQSWVFIW